jgi:hypothetical protein
VGGHTLVGKVTLLYIPLYIYKHIIAFIHSRHECQNPLILHLVLIVTGVLYDFVVILYLHVWMVV